MQKITIAYLVHTFPLYSSSFIVDEIKLLRSLGMQIKLFSVRMPQRGQFPDEYQDFVHETHYLFPLSVGLLIMRNLRAALRSPSRYLDTLFAALSWGQMTLRNRLRTLIHFAQSMYFFEDYKRSACSHIHVHFLTGTASIALWLNRLYDVPYSCTGHGSDIFIYDLLLREKIVHSDFVRLNTRYNQEYLASLLTRDEQSKTKYIPLGVDVENIPVKRHYHSEETVRVLTVGRLVPEKAHDILLKACSLIDHHKYLFLLTIIGDGENRHELEQICRRHSLESVVRFTGALPHSVVLREYQKHDIFAISSISEGSPTVILEAMAVGLPIVAPHLRGIPEVVESEKEGLLYDTGSADKLSEALLRLIYDRNLRVKLGKAGRQKVLMRFNNRISGDKMKMLFNETFERRFGRTR